jgi:adenylate kinase family enzyme
LKRINVIGVSGSGKSTFAKALAEKLGYPHIEMDALFWGPNWYWPSDEEFFEKLEAGISGDNWVLDGNYSRSQPIKWKNVDTIIWIDLPFSRTLFQSVVRTVKRCWSKKELWPGTGNTESFRKSFMTRKSIIWWMIQSYSRTKKRYIQLFVELDAKGVNCTRLRSHEEIDSFLHTISEDG